MKVLIIALSGIGDALMFTPALSELKKNYQKAEIDLLCMIKGVKEIYHFNPNINRIIYFNFLKEGIINSLKFISQIRKRYDVTINVYPSNRSEYNIISYLIGAKKRCAVKYLRKGFTNLYFLNNIIITENDSLHNVEENLLLIEKLLGIKELEKKGMEIFFDNDTQTFANDYIKNILSKDEQTKIVGIHAGCATLKNHIKRRWEPEKFAELIKILKNEYKFNILLFGGPDELELNEQINSLANNSAHIVKTETLLQTAAIMKHCNFFITNDSALMHIASALQLKTLAIFGPTNTNYVHPWKTQHQIAKLNLDCQPCFYYSPKPLTCNRNDIKFKCIKELRVENVLEEFKKLMN